MAAIAQAPRGAPAAAPDRAARRRVRAVLVVALGLAAAGALERSARVLMSRYALPTAGAQWIWAPGALDRREGITFYAVRDFELDAPPERALVHVRADEAYLLHVNGRRVGSGAYVARAPLDTYPVENALRPGWNRVAVELRSARGAGGLLLTVVSDGAPEPLLVTSGEWRVFRDAAGLLEGTRPYASGEPALVWQAPPTGGWGWPRLVGPRAAFDDAVVRRPDRLEPEPLSPRAASSAVSEGASAPVLDFGRAVSGYVLLDGLAGAPRRLVLELGVDGTKEDAIDILLADGQVAWSTTEALTLRYVAPHGLPEGATVAVLPVVPEVAAQDAQRAQLRRRGVFGFAP